MPLRKSNRYLTFLILLSMVVAGFAIWFSKNQEGMAVVLAILGLLLRQEYTDRQARQSRQTINGKLDEIKSTAAESVAEVKSTAEEVKQTAATVIRQTNGELDGKICNAVAREMTKHLQPLIDAVADLDRLFADMDKEIHKIKHTLANTANAEGLKRAVQEREKKQANGD